MSGIVIFTPRKQPEPYDWLWNQQYQKNTKACFFSVNHKVVTAPGGTSVDMCRYMNETFDSEAQYYMRWDSDIIPSERAFDHALYWLDKDKYVGAGLNGWHYRKGYVEFTDNLNAQGVDNWWIFKTEHWKQLPLEGYPDQDKLHMLSLLDRGYKIKCIPDPYLHFGKNAKLISE